MAEPVRVVVPNFVEIGQSAADILRPFRKLKMADVHYILFFNFFCEISTLNDSQEGQFASLYVLNFVEILDSE